MKKHSVHYFAVLSALLGLCVASVASEPQRASMYGYLIASPERIPEQYNAGFSLYSAAWPLVSRYPGHPFQSGLFGTWMRAQLDVKPPGKLYSDIEGGLGWWRSTLFPTETPKFMMGGVAVNFSQIADGPSRGAGDWSHPRGLYGVAQLSPWLLFPLDGLSLKRGTCGQLFGYGYLPLPLAKAKPTTDGKNLPTGDNCWTLFLNTKNFKGPVTFFTPYFWSRYAEKDPSYSGLLLDSRPSEANKSYQMETQYIPAAVGQDENGQSYARVDPVSFPTMPDGNTIVLHRLTSYSKRALYDGVKTWFDGGPEVSGAIDPAGAAVQSFKNGGGSTWKIVSGNAGAQDKPAMTWNSFATATVIEGTSYGYKWNDQIVQRVNDPAGSRVVLPEYFRLDQVNGKGRWVPVPSAAVPAATGLASVNFVTKHDRVSQPSIAPTDPDSPFVKPGPAAGPFKAHLEDGSVVTYYWYRFADQPAMLNADLTPAERESMQQKVEKLHRAWKMDRDYLPPPTVGQLAELDPAEIVTPPKGLEVGYVPIATRQELDSQASR